MDKKHIGIQLYPLAGLALGAAFGGAYGLMADGLFSGLRIGAGIGLLAGLLIGGCRDRNAARREYTVKEMTYEPGTGGYRVLLCADDGKEMTVTVTADEMDERPLSRGDKVFADADGQLTWKADPIHTEEKRC